MGIFSCWEDKQRPKSLLKRMTTAHRPTWHAVLGGENQGGNVLAANSVVRVRDLPQQLNLKVRKPEQKISESLKPAARYSDQNRNEEKIAGALILNEAFQGLEVIKFNDADADEGSKLSKKRMRVDEDSSSEDTSDEEDLMRELAAIKAEKAKEEEEELRKKSIHHNPLLSDVSIHRRWDEEVVFRNQAKFDQQMEKRFINDVVRSDFHKRFMSRYIK